MELGNVERILKDAGYSRDQAKGVAELLAKLNIETFSALDNMPRLIGPAVYGISSYRLVKVIREGTLNPPVKKAAPKKVEPVVEEVEEPKVEEPESKELNNG